MSQVFSGDGGGMILVFTVKSAIITMISDNALMRCDDATPTNRQSKGHGPLRFSLRT